MICTVPGNILLAGEYRITEPCGMGIAMAATLRATLTSIPSSTPAFQNIYLGKQSTWLPGNKNNSLEDIIYTLAEEPTLPNNLFTIDTSPFFSEDGIKKGLGSSAAACLLLSRAIGGKNLTRDALVSLALKAHRYHQGGYGSGYDILASTYGGVGFLCKDSDKTENLNWESLHWPDLIQGVLFRGKSSVQSSHALKQYRLWKTTSPKESENLLKSMDPLLLNMRTQLSISQNVDSYEEIIHALKELTQIGSILGECIGVPAFPNLPYDFGKDLLINKRKGAVLKCLGAGDELIFLGILPEALTKKEEHLLSDIISKREAWPINVDNTGMECL